MGPTAQDAVVIPAEDNNDYTDIYKANLSPAGHAGAAQSKEKPSTSYTLTAVKTRRVQASSPFLQKPDLSIASNKVTPSHPDVTQARGNEFWLKANEDQHLPSMSLTIVRRCWLRYSITLKTIQFYLSFIWSWTPSKSDNPLSFINLYSTPHRSPGWTPRIVWSCMISPVHRRLFI